MQLLLHSQQHACSVSLLLAEGCALYIRWHQGEEHGILACTSHLQVHVQVLITLDIGENSAISTMGEELDASFLVMLAVCNISVKRDQLVDRPLVTVEEAARCGCLTLRSLRDLYPMF